MSDKPDDKDLTSNEPSELSTHIGPRGDVRTVDVAEKAPTRRRAVATSRVRMKPETAARLARGDTPKGEVLATARIAGIMAAKRTPELVPMCHAIALTHVVIADRRRASPAARHDDRRGRGLRSNGRRDGSLVAATIACAHDLRHVEGHRSRDGRRRAWRRWRRAADVPAIIRRHLNMRRGAAASGATSRLARAMVERLDRRLAPRPARSPPSSASFGARTTGARSSCWSTRRTARWPRPSSRASATSSRGRSPSVRVAATHRIGALRVGDVAVACAASAPHRDEAFLACRLLIDRIKARLPIWKREHGPDGPYWVGWEDARCTPEARSPRHGGETHAHATRSGSGRRLRRRTARHARSERALRRDLVQPQSARSPSSTRAWFAGTITSSSASAKLVTAPEAWFGKSRARTRDPDVSSRARKNSRGRANARASHSPRPGHARAGETRLLGAHARAARRRAAT